MISSAAANTWNISGPDFLLLYGVLCGLAAPVAWVRWRSLLGTPHRTSDPTPPFSAYKVAMLTGGPGLAVVAAATKLHFERTLVAGPTPHSLCVGGDLPPAADQLDRDVYEAVRRDPGITTASLRRELAGSPRLTALSDELERAFLIPARRRVAVLRRELAVLGGLVALAGIVPIAAGAASRPDQLVPLAAGVICVVLATARVIRRIPRTTGYGQDLLRRLRTQRVDRALTPHPGESVMLVALFGTGALWIADPGGAAALGVRRELAGTRGGSHYAGSGSNGGGWFGAGGNAGYGWPGGHGGHGGHGGNGGGGHGCGGHSCGGHGCGGGN